MYECINNNIEYKTQIESINQIFGRSDECIQICILRNNDEPDRRSRSSGQCNNSVFGILAISAKKSRLRHTIIWHESKELKQSDCKENTRSDLRDFSQVCPEMNRRKSRRKEIRITRESYLLEFQARAFFPEKQKHQS